MSFALRVAFLLALLCLQGPVSAAQPAMDVASRKVCDVHDMVVAEAQRQERNAAEKSHAAGLLEVHRAKLQAVQDVHAALGMVGHLGEINQSVWVESFFE